MELKHTAMAGTMESSDIMVTIEPQTGGGIQLELTSSVMQQFGRQIESVIRETLRGLGVENAAVSAALQKMNSNDSIWVDDSFGIETEEEIAPQK